MLFPCIYKNLTKKVVAISKTSFTSSRLLQFTVKSKNDLALKTTRRPFKQKKN